MDEIKANPIPRKTGIRGDLSEFAQRPIARQALRFALTTGLSACLSLGLPVVLIEFFDFAQTRAVQIGLVSAYLFNVVVLRTFVFRSRSHWARDLVVYMLANGALRVAEYGLFVVLAQMLELHYAAALVIVLGVATFAKFFAYRTIFR